MRSLLKEWRYWIGPVLVGLCLSFYPHMRAWIDHGNPFWIADEDELSLYLMIASKAFWQNAWHISDPLFLSSAPLKYPWLQFIPFVQVTKIFSASPLAISLAWRIFAGVSIPLAWYGLLRVYRATPFAAAFLATLLSCDSGLLEGKFLAKLFFFALKAISGDETLFIAKPILHPEWRIITPGVSLAALLVFLATLRLLSTEDGRRAWLRPGLAFGLLFHTYFYFWTAAFIGLCAYCLIRPKRWLIVLRTILVGACVGLPEIWRSIAVRQQNSSDWLLRSDKFLPIDHLSEWIMPKITFLILLAIGTYVLRRRKEEFLALWAQAFAGFLLLNHQLLTGLQIENFHWSYHWGPTLSALIALALVECYGKIPLLLRKRSFAFSLTAITLLTAFYLRHLETQRSEISMAINSKLQVLLRHPPDEIPRGSLISGQRYWFDLACILREGRPLSGYAATLSPSLSNQEWSWRSVMNDIFSNSDLEQAKKSIENRVSTMVWGPWSRDPAKRAALLEERLGLFQRLSPIASLNSAEDDALPVFVIREHGDSYEVKQRAIPRRDLPPGMLVGQ